VTHRLALAGWTTQADSEKRAQRLAEALLLKRRTGVEIRGAEVQPGIWQARGVHVASDVRLVAPVYLGTDASIGNAAWIGPGAVVGAGAVVGPDTHVEHGRVGDHDVLPANTMLHHATLERGTFVSHRHHAPKEHHSFRTMIALGGIEGSSRQIAKVLHASAERTLSTEHRITKALERIENGSGHWIGVGANPTDSLWNVMPALVTADASEEARDVARKYYGSQKSIRNDLKLAAATVVRKIYPVTLRPVILFVVTGCDAGKSGVGVFAQKMLPRLQANLETRGYTVRALGTLDELQASGLDAQTWITLPQALQTPSLSAAASLALLPPLVRRAAAVYLPVANRRTLGWFPVPTVGTVHDLAQLHTRRKYGLTRDVYWHHVVLPQLARLRRIATVSDATARDLFHHLHIPKERVQVVHNGLDASTLPVGHKRPWARPYILYPARLEHPGKNHVRVLEAFASSLAREQHDLLFVGEDWGALPLITSTLKRLGLEQKARWLGFVSRGERDLLIAHATLIVAAGLHEGFGLPAAEALAAGVPVAVSNTGALPEVVGPYGILFDPHNVASLAQALDQGCLDHKVRALARAEGPGWVKQFSWDTAAATMTTMMEEVTHEAA